MKKFFLLICVAVLPLFADEKIKSDGNKIFDDKNNLVENTFVSPDGSKELVCHRQDESGDCLISLYDLRSKKLIAESKNQWWCRGVRWTDDYLVYTWATTGGGWRFEYRNYKNLSVEKLVTSYHPFEDPDENLLFDTNYMCLNSDIGIAAYNYSDGNTIKVFSFIDELYAMGVDGLIMQDIGAIALVRKYWPDLPVHVSTQLTSNSLEDIKWYEMEGVRTVVLSRELSLEEIRNIVIPISSTIQGVNRPFPGNLIPTRYSTISVTAVCSRQRRSWYIRCARI